MSLQPQPIAPIPDQTTQVAQAAFPQGNRYMLLRDKMGTIYDDALFDDLFPKRGQPAHSPWSFLGTICSRVSHRVWQRQIVLSGYGWRVNGGIPLLESEVLIWERIRNEKAREKLKNRYEEIGKFDT